MKYLRYEFQKWKRLHLWLIPLAFLTVLVLWMIANNSNSDAEALAQGYAYLLYQLPLINSLLFPVMTATVASRLCDIETKGGKLKELFTCQSKAAFYDCKFLAEMACLLLFIAGETVMVPILGNLYGFTDQLKLSDLARSCLIMVMVTAVVLSIQHFLSLMFANQIIPLFVGLCGSFLGLFSLYLPSSVSDKILWSYYAGFLTSRINWDKGSRRVWFTPVDFPVEKCLLFLLCGIAIYFLLRRIFLKKEL